MLTQSDIGFDRPKDFAQVRHVFMRVKEPDVENLYLVHATLSTNVVDRYDEIVEPDAFKETIGAFIDNPVVLPAHQHRLSDGTPPVIGNVLTDTIRFYPDHVDADILFDDDELGKQYARKYRKNVMRAFSIGFRGLEGTYQQRDEKRAWTWTKIELLEISAVAVGACPGALARVAGFYDLPDTEAMAESVKAAVAGAVSELHKQLMHLTHLVETNLDEVKTMLSGRDGFAEELLGDASDRSIDADAGITEQCDRIKQLVSKENIQ